MAQSCVGCQDAETRLTRAVAHAFHSKQMGFLTGEASDQLAHYALAPAAVDAQLAERLPLLLSTKREIEMERRDAQAGASAAAARESGGLGAAASSSAAEARARVAAHNSLCALAFEELGGMRLRH